MGLRCWCSEGVIAGMGAGIASAMVPVYQRKLHPRRFAAGLCRCNNSPSLLVSLFSTSSSMVHLSSMEGPKNPNQSTLASAFPGASKSSQLRYSRLGCFFVPYSPRWLAGQDRWEEAIRVLANLHGNGDIGHPKVLAQYPRD